MNDFKQIQKEVTIARSELKNIRQEVIKLRAIHKQEVDVLKEFLSKQVCKDTEKQKVKYENEDECHMLPIGYMSSCFKNKNGTPRQSSLCQTSKASLTINKTFFTNPEHSLIGLTEFSYIWILFVFHKNGKNSVKAKVHPPRLNGTSTGVFSTRSPHRPCPIGLSLTKIENITENTIFLSGVDILDGTPVLDIKPYIPSYDIPPVYREMMHFSNEKAISLKDSTDYLITTESNHRKQAEQSFESHPSYICHDNKIAIDKTNDMKNILTDNVFSSVGELLVKPSNHLEVLFTERATKDIEKFHFPSCSINCNYCLKFISNPSVIKQTISEVLQNDPRSVYRKDKCSDKLYYFEIDNLHVTCWFDDVIAEVLRIKPVNK